MPLREAELTAKFLGERSNYEVKLYVMPLLLFSVGFFFGGGEVVMCILYIDGRKSRTKRKSQLFS